MKGQRTPPTAIFDKKMTSGSVAGTGYLLGAGYSAIAENTVDAGKAATLATGFVLAVTVVSAPSAGAILKLKTDGTFAFGATTTGETSAGVFLEMESATTALAWFSGTGVTA